MADQWHYRILGEEFGPVTEAAIRSLIADGTLGPSDEIRQNNQSDWQRADSIGGEGGSDTASGIDLDAMLAGPDVAPATRSAQSRQSDSAAMDLDAMLAPSTPVAHRRAQASEWYYRSRGQKHGPLDFDTLFEHVNEGRLSRYDEILAPGEDGWVEAQTIVGLFPDVGADLDAMLLDTASKDASPAAEKQSPGKVRYYYRVLNQELGPVDFESLFDLVVEGNLRPDDEIRLELETHWRRADSLVGLFPDDMFESAATPADALADEDDDEEPEWYLQVDGQESGPVTFGRLTRMAANGDIQPADQIRLTRLGAWMDAGSMVGLFPEEEPQEASVDQGAPPPSAIPDRPIGDADDWAAAVLSEPEPEPTPSQRPASTSAQQELEQAAASASTDSPSRRPFTPAPAQPTRRPAFTAPPKPRRSGPSFSLPPGLMDAFTNPKVLIGGGVVLLVIAGAFVPWRSLIGADSADLIEELDGIWGQVKPLHEKQAPEAEWASVATQVDPRLKEIAETATSRGAGPSNPGLQIAYMLASDHLPKALEEKQEMSPIRVKTIDNLLSRAKELSQ